MRRTSSQGSEPARMLSKLGRKQAETPRRACPEPPEVRGGVGAHSLPRRASNTARTTRFTAGRGATDGLQRDIGPSRTPNPSRKADRMAPERRRAENRAMRAARLRQVGRTPPEPPDVREPPQ